MNLTPRRPKNIRGAVFAAAVFSVAFLAVPFDHLKLLTLMPGDIGDSRLLNYLLENIYLFLSGKSPSLVNLSFFYPFPAVLGFSDNLFGSSPAYLVPRALGAHHDTAFQFWYFFGFLVNFIGCYYALRRLGASALASSVGALIFTFSLPVTGQIGHSQLHYRFGVPLGIAMTVLFLKEKNWRYFVAAMAWLVWQFYCTIYIGFFLALFIVAMIGVYASVSLFENNRLVNVIREFQSDWIIVTPSSKVKFGIYLAILCVAMGLLFYPYVAVSVLYEAKRSLAEIATMLPRLQSYFLSDGSWLWSSQSAIFSVLPMRHEHQIFIGAVPMLLAVAGLLCGDKRDDGLSFQLLTYALGALILATLYVGGLSLWYFVAQFPLASAIRAMTRIVLVFLFPVAYLAALAVDRLTGSAPWRNKVVVALLIPLLVFEFMTVSPYVSSKAEWRSRLDNLERLVPKSLPEQPIFFFAQSGSKWYAAELDAMWVALIHRHPTLNGYSGIQPPGYSGEYGDDCSALPQRIVAYFNFLGGDLAIGEYRRFASRVVPIGFSNCNPAWLDNPPRSSVLKRSLTSTEFSRLSLEGGMFERDTDRSHVLIRVVNSGDEAIPAQSAVNTPPLVSWRFLDADGAPLSGWDPRRHLPFDVPAHGSIPLRLSIDPKLAERSRYLEVSILQEFVFWGHDVGVKPLRVELSTVR